ncbi:hypothetical protein E5093_11265 [Acinetobacter indicus]|uniref:DUF6602 domain-containing protein n=1 Tax=Acinetobacter indicus TaxID=756892 RepID=UPI00159F35B3|nr:DUF6602 domain-containing protein [Acinetobacter indicus]QLB60098.1 hypothetical protein E5093_11265 [Acinetobacter indicus]
MSNSNALQFLVDKTETVRTLKLKKTEFQGLGHELSISQKDLMNSYNRSKNIKHTRDLGTHREEILRKHLLNAGLVPPKFLISEISCRVADTNGNYSRELDILFSNHEERILLMKRGNTLEVHPVENTYGTIQIKSKVTQTELESAFENIASYKRLRKNRSEKEANISNEGFGIIFFYTTDLDNEKLTESINSLKNKYSLDLVPNAIFILDHGHFILQHKDSYNYFLTDHISSCQNEELTYFCNPNHDDHLFHFHSILLYLLQNTRTFTFKLSDYYNIGNIDFNTNISFKFMFGEHHELMTCDKHKGDDYQYLKTIKSENLEKIYNSVINTQFYDENFILFNIHSDNLVKIYNPEKLELDPILKYDENTMIYEKIIINKLGNKINVLLPCYYILKENLFEDCPRCQKNLTQKINRQKTKLKSPS